MSAAGAGAELNAIGRAFAAAKGSARTEITDRPTKPAQVAKMTMPTELDYRGQIDEAIDAAETAIMLDPNLAYAHALLGRLHAKAGHPERTAAFVEHAMRLSPRDPYTANWLYIIGMAQLQMGHYDEAIATFRKSIVVNPNLATSRESLSAAYLGSGREAEARSVLADVRREAATRMPDQVDEQLLLIACNSRFYSKASGRTRCMAELQGRWLIPCVHFNVRRTCRKPGSSMRLLPGGSG
jgi:tetratricopeptide (TPR) repeat protein